MRPIRVKGFYGIRHPEDCKRIQDILINKGLYATLEQCQQLWETYSEDHWCAGWLVLEGSTNDDIYNAVKEYIEEGPDSGMDTRYL
jgi:hypothetical protein